MDNTACYQVTVSDIIINDIIKTQHMNLICVVHRQPYLHAVWKEEDGHWISFTAFVWITHVHNIHATHKRALSRQ